MTDHEDDFDAPEDNAADPLKNKLRQLAEDRRARDQADLAKKAAERQYRQTEAEIIAMLEESGQKGRITFNFGGELGTISFQKKSTIYGRVLDRNQALDVFEERAMVDEMTEPKISDRRLNEFVRNELEQGNDLPDGIDYHERKFVSISGI
jgi:hypothetical protein